MGACHRGCSRSSEVCFPWWTPQGSRHASCTYTGLQLSIALPACPATCAEEGTKAINAGMLATMSNLECQRRRALARAINYAAERHPEALDFSAIYGRLSQPLAAGGKLDEHRPPPDLMKAVRFEELYSLCELLVPSMVSWVRLGAKRSELGGFWVVRVVVHVGWRTWAAQVASQVSRIPFEVVARY